MKKEIIIILFIAIFIIALNYITQNYTKESINLLNNSLNELKQEVSKDDAKKDILENKIEEIYSLWKEREYKLAFYIEHDELEKVESKLKLIKGNIENESYEETIPDIEDVIFILMHIEEKYKFIIKNVF